MPKALATGGGVNLQSYLTQRQALINRALAGVLPKARQVPGKIHEAMRYSVLGEGKRIRPILALAACDAVGGKIAKALPAACALEMIHAYSLVHDDLPSMDNDDFRRGKPSCHKQFGEALGVLTGDALLTYSFELLSRGNKARANGSASFSRSHGNPDSPVRLKVIQEVTRAIGTQGMIGGQVLDIACARGKVGPSQLQEINRRKTGALIAASVRVGALLGGSSPESYRRLSRYGTRIGLVFQLVDDLMDQDGFAKLYDTETLRRRAQRLTRSAVEAVASLGNRAQALRALAQFILTRNC